MTVLHINLLSGSGSGRIVNIISGIIRFRPDLEISVPVHPYFLLINPDNFMAVLCTLLQFKVGLHSNEKISLSPSLL